MSDIDIIREALTVLHSRLDEEGYGPQFDQPDPGELFHDALVALDRIVQQLNIHTNGTPEAQRELQECLAKALTENARLSKQMP